MIFFFEEFFGGLIGVLDIYIRIGKVDFRFIICYFVECKNFKFDDC